MKYIAATLLLTTSAFAGVFDSPRTQAYVDRYARSGWHYPTEELDKGVSFCWTARVFAPGETYCDPMQACRVVTQRKWVNDELPHTVGLHDPVTEQSSWYQGLLPNEASRFVLETFNTRGELICFKHRSEDDGELYPGYKNAEQGISLDWPNPDDCEQVNEFEAWYKEQAGFWDGQLFLHIDAVSEAGWEPDGRFDVVAVIASSMDHAAHWIDEHGISRTSVQLFKSDLFEAFNGDPEYFVYKIGPAWDSLEPSDYQHGCVRFN